MPITRFLLAAPWGRPFTLLLLVLCGQLSFTVLAAQSIAESTFIVRTAPGRSPAVPTGTLVRRLGPDTYRLTYPANGARQNPAAALNADPGVLLWQVDEAVTFRQTPTDELYPRQATHLELVGLPRAWDLTTGGTAPNGDRIVVAILDEGFDLAHEDLLNNTWTNTGEVPNDGIDNDGNGYVDDLHGWNFKSDRPTFPDALHGQSVAGIIGAQGDNGIGTTGVNWSVDLMYFAIETVSDIVAAYEYVLDQRVRYNNSQGREGSLVVVTNASFGVEGGRCSSYAVWADMYDRL
ncbi:MAG: S8 family serine peptidase, partial [Saprospiraceae bacterium]